MYGLKYAFYKLRYNDLSDIDSVLACTTCQRPCL